MRLSFNQEADFRQLRDFGQKFSATFEFIGAHWRGLGRALLYIVLPAALLRGVLSGLFQKQVLTSLTRNVQLAEGGTGMLARLGQLGSITSTPIYWASISMSVMFGILLVLTLYGYMRLCLQPVPASAPIAISAVWAEVRRNFFGAFFSYFGISILIGLGFLFLGIPGLYLMVAFSLFYAVKVMEHTGFAATANRCIQLVRGKWWSTLGLIFVMAAMLWVLMIVVGSLCGALVFGLGRGLGISIYGSGAEASILSIITSTLTSLFALLAYPAVFIALAFQYFNLVERHDGVGLHNLVNQLGQAPVAATNASYHPDDEGEY